MMRLSTKCLGALLALMTLFGLASASFQVFIEDTFNFFGERRAYVLNVEPSTTVRELKLLFIGRIKDEGLRKIALSRQNKIIFMSSTCVAYSRKIDATEKLRRFGMEGLLQQECSVGEDSETLGALGVDRDQCLLVSIKKATGLDGGMFGSTDCPTGRGRYIGSLQTVSMPGLETTFAKSLHSCGVTILPSSYGLPGKHLSEAQLKDMTWVNPYYQGLQKSLAHKAKVQAIGITAAHCIVREVCKKPSSAAGMLKTSLCEADKEGRGGRKLPKRPKQSQPIQPPRTIPTGPSRKRRGNRTLPKPPMSVNRPVIPTCPIFTLSTDLDSGITTRKQVPTGGTVASSIAAALSRAHVSGVKPGPDLDPDLDFYYPDSQPEPRTKEPTPGPTSTPTDSPTASPQMTMPRNRLDGNHHTRVTVMTDDLELGMGSFGIVAAEIPEAYKTKKGDYDVAVLYLSDMLTRAAQLSQSPKVVEELIYSTLHNVAPDIGTDPAKHKSIREQPTMQVFGFGLNYYYSIAPMAAAPPRSSKMQCIFMKPARSGTIMHSNAFAARAVNPAEEWISDKTGTSHGDSGGPAVLPLATTLGQRDVILGIVSSGYEKKASNITVWQGKTMLSTKPWRPAIKYTEFTNLQNMASDVLEILCKGFFNNVWLLRPNPKDVRGTTHMIGGERLYDSCLRKFAQYSNILSRKPQCRASLERDFCARVKTRECWMSDKFGVATGFTVCEKCMYCKATMLRR